MFKLRKIKFNLYCQVVLFLILSFIFPFCAFGNDASQVVKPISNVLMRSISQSSNPASNFPVPDVFTDRETVRSPVRKNKLTGKVLDSTTGQGAAQAQVFVIANKEYQKSVFTDNDGNFQFDDYPRNIMQGLIYALKDNYCTEYKVIKGRTTEAELILKPSCRIEGIVTSENSQPLADCTVELHTLMSSNFLITQKTNENGVYQFENLPVGDFQIYITHPQWYQLQDTLTSRKVTTEFGKITSFQTTMREKFPLEGIVTGPDDKPVAGASISVPSFPALVSGISDDIVKTNTDGYFKIYSGNLNPESIRGSFARVVVSALAEGLGTGTVEVRKYKDEHERDNSKEKLAIKLNGIARISGQVKDTKGNPVPDVSVYLKSNHDPMDKTDASGNYNLEWFALPVKANETFEVIFKALRPDDGSVMGGILGVMGNINKPMEIPKPGTQYYLNQTVSVTAKHGMDLGLNPVLEPADLLTISGTVTNKNSEVVPNANLILYAGNAPKDVWIGRIDSSRVRRREGIGSDGVNTLRHNFYPIARTVTDNYGNYTICVVRETVESFNVITRTNTSATIDTGYYSLGVLSPDNESTLITDIRPDDRTNNIKLDIKLPEAP